jgi:hypothetical protein
MGLITDVVTAISDDVVAGLALTGALPLTDGAILLGSAMVAQTNAPPRVVFEPVSTRFGPADRAGSGALPGPSGISSDLAAALLTRTLGTAFVKFRVHCWAIADVTPGANHVPAQDIDALEALLTQVWRSCLRINPGITVLDGGLWANSARGADALLAVSGWYAMFYVEIPLPITDYSLEWANTTGPGDPPVGVEVETYIAPGDGGAPEAGPVIVVPYVPPPP